MLKFRSSGIHSGWLLSLATLFTVPGLILLGFGLIRHGGGNRLSKSKTPEIPSPTVETLRLKARVLAPKADILFLQAAFLTRLLETVDFRRNSGDHQNHHGLR